MTHEEVVTRAVEAVRNMGTRERAASSRGGYYER